MKLEGLPMEHFQGREIFEELSPAVASYRPGGGDHLLDEEALASEFRHALRRLQKEWDLESEPG